MKSAGARVQLPMRAPSTTYLPVIVFWQVLLASGLGLVALQRLWSVCLAGLLILLGILATVPVNGRSLPQTLAHRRDFLRRQKNFVVDPSQPNQLVPLAQWLPKLEVTQIKDAHDGQIGVIADGQCWTGVLEINSDLQIFSDRGSMLNLEELGGVIRQDDVLFAGVQLVTFTVGAPTKAMLPEGSPAVDAYLEILGSTPPPPAVRRSWLALRLDPRLCLEAVGRRGNGQLGVFATLRFGLHRVQTMLKRRGISTAPLDPMGISDVLELTVGSGPEPHSELRSVETWRDWICDGLTHESRPILSFGKDPSASYQHLLQIASSAPAMMVLTSYTISPGQKPRGAIRLVTNAGQQAREADEAVLKSAGKDLVFGPREGNQVPGMLATVPLGRQVH